MALSETRCSARPAAGPWKAYRARMRRMFFAAAIALIPASLHADILCTATTEPEAQYRTTMKHRAPATASADHASVDDIAGWDPPQGAADSVTRRSDNLIDPHESHAYLVEGDAWRIRSEANDCDIHLEMSMPGAGVTAPRVIVEIPQGAAFTAARNTILAAAGNLSARDRSSPVHLRMTGYGFWDGHHWTRRDPRVGHAHGSARVATLWEIHPAWNVEVLGADAVNATAPVNAVPTDGQRAQCCDGTTSATCMCPAGPRCCRGHGGVCGCVPSAPTGL